MKAQFFKKPNVLTWALMGVVAYLLLFLGPVCQAQFYYLAGYDRAKSLKAGQVEIAPEYTFVFYNKNNLCSNLGVTAAIGISDRFDVKLNYGRYFTDGNDQRSNAFYIAPKYTGRSNYVAIKVALGYYFERYETPGPEGQLSEWRKLFMLSPRLIVTPISGDKAELNITTFFDAFFENEEPLSQVGMTIGGGFSKDLSKWSFRPEFGFYFVGSELSMKAIYWHTGASLSYRIGSIKKRND